MPNSFAVGTIRREASARVSSAPAEVTNRVARFARGWLAVGAGRRPHGRAAGGGPMRDGGGGWIRWGGGGAVAGEDREGCADDEGV